MTAVHQLLPVFSYGDAIGGTVVRARQLLIEMGFESRVYADLHDRRLDAITRPADALLSPGEIGPEDAVIYHLSLGSRLAALFMRQPGRRLLWFHNITPPAFYRQVNAGVAYWTERGWRELHDVAPAVETVITPSTYNLREAMAAGAPSGTVLPIFDIGRLRPRANRPATPPIILFVGRVAPNKRHEDLIRALAVLRCTTVPQARLRLLGSADDCEPYLQALHQLIRRLGLADVVELSGRRVSDEQVADAYAAAAVFATASEHEGFCVPLLEAMAFGVPIVANAAGAIPETADDAAVVLAAKDPFLWAEALGRCIADQPLRAAMVSAGRRRLGHVANANLGRRLSQALEEIGLRP